MPDILGEQPEDIAGSAGSLEGYRIAFKRLVELQAQTRRHSEHPIMACEALEVLEDRLSDAEYAYEDDGEVDHEDVPRHFGCTAD